MKTITTIVCNFNELDEKTQEKAIDNYRDINTDHDWHEFTLEKWREILETIGVNSPQINFSGFCSQGDGASFTGNYSYSRGALKALRKEYPKFTELHDIVEALQGIQKHHFYTLTCELYRFNSHYSHENTIGVTNCEDQNGWQSEGVERELLQNMRELMRLIYSELSDEYDYLTGDESVKETLIINEYYFTNKGRIA